MGNRLARLGMTAMAAVELIGCGGPGKLDTTPRPGETIEKTDAGVLITANSNLVRTKIIKKVEPLCGTKRALRESKKWDCPELARDIYKHPKKRGQYCIDCVREKVITVTN